MGTTANYSWPTPVATDLVKDGWEAIKDLGDAADTTVKAVSDAQGLIHINTTSFTSVATQSIDNVFSSTYDNYLLLVNMTTSGTNSEFKLRFRASGTDTSTNYADQRLFSSATTPGSNANWQGTDELTLGFGETAIDNYHYTMQIMSPNLAARTKTYGYGGGVSGVTFYTITSAGVQASSTQFDGFTIINSIGNITGTLSVYGYRKS